MKNVLLLGLALFASSMLFAQDPDGAEKLVGQGVELHDKGDYSGAIALYDKALSLDKDNLLALAEKAYTLVSMQKYEEGIACCKAAIAAHPGAESLDMVYVNYGTALDELGKPEKAIEIYDEGIEVFPEYYLLQYNKGITYIGMENTEEALACFYKSIMFNPRHGSSHNAIARIMDFQKNRIPALLAYCRFLVVEPEGTRAAANLESLLALMGSGIEKTGRKSITINIDEGMLSDTTEDGQIKENAFAMTDLLLSMDAALDIDKENKKKTQAELFIRKIDNVISSMKESKEGHTGFFWDYYVPYFVEMQEEGLVETFGYIAFASSGQKDVKDWIDENGSKIDKFYKWSNDFRWYSK